jgi:dienelactone hydrolase
MTAGKTWIDEFPGNFVWSIATVVTKGMAPYGAVALGEIDEVCERLRPRQGEPHAWTEEWSAMGRRLEAVAAAAAAAGREMTAGNFHLRAGMYYFTAERFVPPGDEKRAIGKKALACQHAGLRRRHPNIEFVEVPYERTTLPALFMKAPGVSGRAPTVVVFDGMDNCKEMSVLFAGLEFAARGWHTLAIDGPGQGESLRLRDLHARHDYEVPGTAAYEYVAARADVDPGRVVVMGYSFAKAERFSLADVAPKIACPFLVVHAEDDRVVPVASAHRLYEALGSPRKHLKIFTRADGSTYHAQADNRQVGVDYIADWIGGTL